MRFNNKKFERILKEKTNEFEISQKKNFKENNNPYKINYYIPIFLF